jgi:hypothetical protein
VFFSRLISTAERGQNGTIQSTPLFQIIIRHFGFSKYIEFTIYVSKHSVYLYLSSQQNVSI